MMPNTGQNHWPSKGRRGRSSSSGRIFSSLVIGFFVLALIGQISCRQQQQQHHHSTRHEQKYRQLSRRALSVENFTDQQNSRQQQQQQHQPKLSQYGSTQPSESLTMSSSEIRSSLARRSTSRSTHAVVSTSDNYDPFRDFIAMESRSPVRVQASPRSFQPMSPTMIPLPPSSKRQSSVGPVAGKKQRCEFHLDSRGGNLTSSGYPANYLPNQNCVYRIRRNDPSVCQLWLRFNYFELLNSTEQSEFHITHKLDCVADYLEFDDRVRFCGALSWPGKMETVEIDQAKEEFIFRFRSDGAHSGGGFSIEYRPIKNSCYDERSSAVVDVKPAEDDAVISDIKSQGLKTCGEKHSEMDFEILSPGFPDTNYTNGLDCVHYVVRASNDVCGLELKFVKFELEESEGCTFDFLEVDGESFCGRLPEGSRNIFDFHNPTKTISFQTDLKNNDRGFHVKVRQLTSCENSFMPLPHENEHDSAHNTGKCHFHVQDSSGELSSLFYPNSYPNDVDCEYTIQKPATTTDTSSSNIHRKFCSVVLNFVDFNLKTSDDCREDFLEIDGEKFCGETLKNSKKILEFGDQEQVKLVFRTSDSTKSHDYRGFALNYTLQECQEPTLARSSRNSVCEKRFTSKNFLLTSDITSNRTYPDNSDCRYVIEKYSQRVCYVEMNFKKFDLEASPDCQYDYVEVGQAVRLCGTLQSETSRIYRFLDPEMSITFHSDASNSREGFEIDIEQLECEGERIVRQPNEFSAPVSSNPTSHRRQASTPSLKPEIETGDSLQSLDSAKNESKIFQQQQQLTEEFDLSKSPSTNTIGGCNRVHDEREFFLETPGFPTHYPVDQDCIFIIKPHSPGVCKLEFNFDQFDLQPFDWEKNCQKSDYVDMDSRESLCGSRTRDRKIYPFLNSSFYVHFHSDSFPTSFDRGFRMFVRQIDCSTSGGSALSPLAPIAPTKGQGTFSRCNRVYTTQSFEIKSPLYPTPYIANSQCAYRIIKNRDIKVCFLEIEFLDFDLEQSPNCLKDAFTLNGMRLCGNIRKNSVRLLPFQNSEFVLGFSSDSVGSGKGFNVRVRQIECPGSGSGTAASPHSSLESPAPLDDHSTPHQIVDANQKCQKIFDSEVFEMENPNYPNYYLPALSCAYIVRRRNSRICQIELQFLDLDIEPTVNCAEDYLLIDGKKYCNNNRPSSGSLILPFFEVEKRFHFRSANFRRRKGYLVQGKQIDCTLQQPKPWTSLGEHHGHGQFSAEKLVFLPSLPSICEICVTQVNGHIQSYDYPSFYPPNVNCSYSITPLPDNCMVKITFDKFDFDYSQECNQDYLEINGVRYCGNQLQGVSMLLLNKRKEDLNIRMVSNARGALIKPSFQGFRASYTQLPCLDDGSDSGSNAPSQPPKISRTDIKGAEDIRELRPSSEPKPSIMPATSPSKPVKVAEPSVPAVTESPSMPQPKPTEPSKPKVSQPAPDSMKNFDNEPIFCDQNFDESSFEIKSPGYPYRYYDKLNCIYGVEKSSKNVCRLKLTFNYFNVIGEDGECNGDYLNVFSSKLCGVLPRHTTKEIPFVQDRVVMNFYTNDARTANGFHVIGEQIECNPGGDPDRSRSDVAQKKPEVTTEKSDAHHDFSDSSGTGHRGKGQIKEQEPALNQLKYDDEPHEEPLEQHSSTRMPPKSDVTKKKFDAGVVYDSTDVASKPTDYPSRPDYHSGTKGGGYSSPGRGMVIEMPKKHSEQMPRFPPPSHGTKGGGYEPQDRSRASSVTPIRRPEVVPTRRPMMPDKPSRPIQGGEHRTICNEQVIDRMYFELKSSDLKPVDGMSSSSASAAACQLNIKKARPNICQLDVMFVRYDLTDSSCGQQYVSIDGERVCGRVPENGVKKFWFIRPDMLIFAKLNPATLFGGEEKFVLKIRQVECSEQQQRNLADTKGSGRSKPKFYEQKRIDDPVEKNMKKSPILDDMNTDDPESRQGFNPYCDLIGTEQEYKIVSPRRPGPHRCRYTIRKFFNQICAVDIRFAKFRLEDGPDGVCDRESVEIDSGKICGTFPANHERRYYFLPNEMEKIIYFTSNRSESVPGDFVLNVKQIQDCSKPLVPTPQLATPTICDMTSIATRGSFKSPNYPSPYDDFTRCTYRIKQASHEYCKVRVVLRDVDIERDPRTGCSKDVLELGREKICGRNPQQKQYLIPFDGANSHDLSEVKLKFNSDGTGNGRGFNLEYSQEKCAREEPSPIDHSGLKSSPSSQGVRFVPMSPMSTSRSMMKSSSSLNGQAMNDPNSLGRSPMRPFYPPNYVSKAHLMKQMERKEFVKMMMTEQEKEQLKIEDPERQQFKISDVPEMENFGDNSSSNNKKDDTSITPTGAAFPSLSMVMKNIDTVDDDEDKKKKNDNNNNNNKKNDAADQSESVASAASIITTESPNSITTISPIMQL